MAFPTSPTDGQLANVNGVTYTYSSARTAWTVTSSFLDTFTGNALIANSATITGELSADFITSGNILPAANNTYSLGNATTVWTDLYLANSTIYLGQATIGASGANLVLPSTVQIGNAVLTESGGSLAMPENMSATSMVVSGNVAAGNVSTVGEISAGVGTFSGNISVGNVSTVGTMSAGTGTFSGNVTAVSVHPAAGNTHDLGTSTLRWRNIYTNDLNLNNGIGDWTIVEGADDLFLYNNLRNKVYKFALIEVGPDEATPKINEVK
jgi:hypothetical protein